MSMPTADATADADALLDVLTEHDIRLRALALRLLGDPGLVDDALQDTYVRAFQALSRFRGDAALATWLYRILHNVCLDELRRRRRRAEQPYDEGRSTEPLAITTSFGVAADSADLAAERADLAVGLAGLPAGQRAAIVLVDGYGMNYEAVGTMLGVPAGTVGSRLFRARTVLRQALAEKAA